MSELSYAPETRLVAFIDILGFKDQTKRCLDDPELLKALDRGLASTDMLSEPYQGYTTSVRMFSDCICVSSPFEPNNVFKFIYTIEAVQMNLACAGVFMRGGIAIGRHFESPRMILSEGLIEAYQLESTQAKFPRILLSEATAAQIVEAAGQVTEPDSWDGGPSSFGVDPDAHLRRDQDGFRFISYLMSLRRIDRSAMVDMYITSHHEAVRDWVKEGRERNLPESIRAKHEWARTYHNAMIRELLPLGGGEDDIPEE